jgi:hypothetical protein
MAEDNLPEITAPATAPDYSDLNVYGNVLFPRDEPGTEPQVRSLSEFEMVPPGNTFIQMTEGSDNFGQRLLREPSTVPTLTLDGTNPTDELALIDLPDKGYYYTFDVETEQPSLRQKMPDDPSVFNRAFSRLWGTDVNPRSLGLEVPRIVSTVVGGVGGGSIGSKVPTAPGPLGVVVNPVTGTIALSAIGTMVGAVAPEQVMEIGESLGFAEEGWREKYGYSDEELRTLFINEGLLDLAFSGLFTGGRVLGRPATRLFSGITREAKDLAKTAQKMGVAMMPVQLGERGIARAFVPVLGRFPLWGAPFKFHGENAQKGFLEYVQDLPQRFHNVSGMDALSLDMLSGAKKVLSDVEKSFGQRYDTIFKAAADLDAGVVPTNAFREANKISKEMREAVTRNPTNPDMPTGTLSPAQTKFLEVVDEILDLQTQAMRTGESPTWVPRTDRPGSAPVFPTRNVMMDTGESLNEYPQSLEAMDNLLSKLDEAIGTIRTDSGKIPDNLGAYYSDLSNALKTDVVGNMVQREIGPEGIEQFARTDATANLGKELRELDTEFAYVMQSIYDTSAAKVFGTVRRGGLRSVVKPSNEELRKSAATLAKTYFDELPKNPNIVYDIARMMPGEVFQQFKADYLNELFQRSLSGRTTGSEGVFNMELFRRNLGLASDTGDQVNRRTALENLFKVDRSGLKMEVVEDILTMPEMAKILEVGETLSSIDIPNASVFIQRRLTLGGPQAVVGSIFPGAAVGTAVGSSKWGIGSLMAALGFIGGVRLMSSALANPATALPIMKVLDQEASGLQRKQNFVRAIRASLRGGSAAVVGGADALMDRANEFLDEYEQDVDLSNPSEEVVELEQSLIPEVEETVAVAEPPPFSPMREQVPPPPLNVASAPPQQPGPSLASLPSAAPPQQGIAASSPENRARFAAMFPNDLASGVIRSQGIGSLV